MFHVERLREARPGRSPRMSQHERRTLQYSGHVQGVGFRWTVRSIMEDLPVTGYVRNLRDGTVQLVLEGRPRDLDAAEDGVRAALASYVRDVARSISPATGEFDRFTITR